MTSTAAQLPVPDHQLDDDKGLTQHFIVIEPKPWGGYRRAPLIEAWNRAVALNFPNDTNPPFTVLEGGLRELDAKLLQCDCMVSPANSFGIMDGSYDDVLSRAFEGGSEGYWTLTNHVQAHIKQEWHGYLPPGSCMIVPLPSDLAGSNNPWSARFIAVLPTMRTPENVSWHKDLVYNCMWSLQVAIENWNRNLVGQNDMIKRVLMTGLATGCGRIGPDKCAQQESPFNSMRLFALLPTNR